MTTDFFPVSCTHCPFEAKWIPGGPSTGTVRDIPGDYSLCGFVSAEQGGAPPLTCEHFRKALAKVVEAFRRRS